MAIEIKLENSLVEEKPLPSFENPSFLDYKEDLVKLRKTLEPYQKYQNLIVIGNGGSITTLQGVWRALGETKSSKNLFVLSTMEPDVLVYLKEKFPKNETLAMSISKSGKTVGILEDAYFFKDYPGLVITSPGDNPLRQIASKSNWQVLDHSELGGRFSGFSSTAYAPEILLGLNGEKIDKGKEKIYNNTQSALRFSQTLFELEKDGYTEIFMPVYSWFLEGLINLAVQLIHESVGKEGKGQTIYGALAPESQHHTNQRFFGGRKNVVGLFVRVKEQKNSDLKIEEENITYAQALWFEAEGTMRDAIEKKIPVLEIKLEKINEENIGEFIGFWQLVAYYSAKLRGVNPFDQPQVEKSKQISIELRKEGGV